MAIQESWERTRPDKVEKIGWKYITTKYFRHDGGDEKAWTTVGKIGHGAAGVIALTSDYRVIIARQFRPGPEKVLCDLPGGAIDEDEDPREAALRELQEETGYAATGRVESLGSLFKDAYVNDEHHYYLAYDCSKVTDTLHLDDGEFIDVTLVSIEDFIAYAKQGLVNDAPAVLMAYDQLQQCIDARDKKA